MIITIQDVANTINLVLINGGVNTHHGWLREGESLPVVCNYLPLADDDVAIAFNNQVGGGDYGTLKTGRIFLYCFAGDEVAVNTLVKQVKTLLVGDNGQQKAVKLYDFNTKENTDIDIMLTKVLDNGSEIDSVDTDYKKVKITVSVEIIA